MRRASSDRLNALARDTAVVLAVSAGLLVGLELFLRVLAPQELTGTSVRGAHFSRPDSALGLRYNPGAVWRFRHPEYRVTYAINSDGFRDAKRWSGQKSPGTLRVLLLGDSFTFGQGAEYNQTWPVLVERELERRGVKVELVKAGMQGLDTRSEFVLLRRLVDRYRVDAVVVGFLINDLYSNLPYVPGSEAEAPPPELEEVQHTVFRQEGSDRKFHLLTLARRIAAATDAGYMALYLAAANRGEYLKVPLSSAVQRQLGVTDTLFLQMAAYCDSLRKPLVVFSMPQQFQVMYARNGRTDKGIDVAYYDRHFAQLAKGEGFQWVSAFEALVEAEKTSGKDTFYRLDGHFTPYGNAVAAEVFTAEVIPRILAESQGGRPKMVFPGRSENSVDKRGERRALSKYQQTSHHE